MSKPRILLVEDDSTQMKYFIQALREEFEVVVRSDVSKAVATFKEEADQPGWSGVIMDIMMPSREFEGQDPSGMSTGLHVLRALRAIQPDIPVIVFTNSMEESVLEECRSYKRVRIHRKLDVWGPADLVKLAKSFFNSGAVGSQAGTPDPLPR